MKKNSPTILKNGRMPLAEQDNQTAPTGGDNVIAGASGVLGCGKDIEELTLSPPCGTIDDNGKVLLCDKCKKRKLTSGVLCKNCGFTELLHTDEGLDSIGFTKHDYAKKTMGVCEKFEPTEDENLTKAVKAIDKWKEHPPFEKSGVDVEAIADKIWEKNPNDLRYSELCEAIRLTAKFYEELLLNRLVDIKKNREDQRKQDIEEFEKLIYDLEFYKGKEEVKTDPLDKFIVWNEEEVKENAKKNYLFGWHTALDELKQKLKQLGGKDE